MRQIQNRMTLIRRLAGHAQAHVDLETNFVYKSKQRKKHQIISDDRSRVCVCVSAFDWDLQSDGLGSGNKFIAIVWRSGE